MSALAMVATILATLGLWKIAQGDVVVFEGLLSRLDAWVVTGLGLFGDFYVLWSSIRGRSKESQATAPAELRASRPKFLWAIPVL